MCGVALKLVRDLERDFAVLLHPSAVKDRADDAEREQHAADERTGRTAAGRIADGVADEEQHERQHVDERRKAEHAAGLALDEHAVADAGIGMVARGDVERLGLQTAAAAALGAVMAARRTARYLDLCPAAGKQLFDGSLLGHFDSVLIFTLVIAYSGLYSSMMRNAARMPSTAADMMPPA